MPIRKEIAKEYLAKHRDEIGIFGKGFDLLKDHVVITDPDGNVIYANRAALKATGFILEEVLGKNPGDLWGGHMPKEFYEKMWKTIKEDKKSFVGEVKNVRKNGEEYWQEINIAPVLDEGEKIKFFIGVEPIIDDRKNREKLKDEFISIIGHQLLGPLAVNRWVMEWFLAQKNLTDEQAKKLEDVFDRNKQVINLIADLLIISRAQNIDVNREDFDLSYFIKTLISELKDLYPNKLIELKRADPAIIRANKNLVIQVFRNIIINAVDYSDPVSGHVEVSLASSKDGFVFSCKDNGIGIPVEEASKIFTRFFRASNVSRAKSIGTGLGLFIVKTICDLLGWKVYFTSDEGRGTTFYVESNRIDEI